MKVREYTGNLKTRGNNGDELIGAELRMAVLQDESISDAFRSRTSNGSIIGRINRRRVE
jgi:hypothetical protein